MVTVREPRLGILMASGLEARQRRLSTLQLATSLRPIPVDERVAEAWAGLIARLRAVSRRMPLNDSWIAASALAYGMAVVTRDNDFDVVAGLTVVKV